VGASGNAYVTGTTTSSDFPTTPGAFQTTPGDGFGRIQDAFVSKLNAAGSALVYSTYLGATDTAGFGIAVDAKGNAFVAGFTNSANFPTTPGAFQTTYGGLGDAFVTKLNAAGSGLLYSTYLGGGGDDLATAIEVDAAGNSFVTGHTSSTDFPTTRGAFQTICGGCNGATNSGDAFITKLDPDGSALLYSTFLGGSGDETGNSVAVDATANAYVTGSTSSTDFPTTRNAFQAAYGGGISDAFVSKLNAAGSVLVYSTYMGGNDIDNGTGIALRRERAERYDRGEERDQTALRQAQNDDRFDDKTASGNAYVTGYSFSSNFPTTPGAFQTVFGGVADAFVAKIATLTFAGRPGKANCNGKSVSALVRQFGGLNNSTAVLGFVSVQALQDAIREFCEDSSANSRPLLALNPQPRSDQAPSVPTTLRLAITPAPNCATPVFKHSTRATAVAPLEPRAHQVARRCSSLLRRAPAHIAMTVSASLMRPCRDAGSASYFRLAYWLTASA
jgi:hypothetical protein